MKPECQPRQIVRLLVHVTKNLYGKGKKHIHQMPIMVKSFFQTTTIMVTL
jgi:hypothetical protein